MTKEELGQTIKEIIDESVKPILKVSIATNNSVQNLKQEFGLFKEEVDKRFDGVDKRFEKLEKMVVSGDEEIVKLIIDGEERIEKLEKSFKEYKVVTDKKLTNPEFKFVS